MTKILVAEDEQNLRSPYEQELQEEGYAVVAASDGREALDLFRREHPDLIVQDILMSAYRDSFLSWSADAYVIKSADMKELKTEIRRLLVGRTAAPHERAI